MSEYRLHFTQGASCSVTVEADDLEAAIDKAYNELPSGLCAHCSGSFSRGPGIDLSGDWELDQKSASEDYPS